MILGVTGIVLPILLVPQAYDPFRFPKVLLVRLAGLTVIAVLLIGVALHVEPREIRPKKDRFLILGVSIVGWCVVSGLLAGGVAESGFAIVNVVAGLGLFFAARLWSRTAPSRSILYMLLIPGVINAVLIILQMYNVWHPLVSLSDLEGLPSGDREILVRAALLGNRDDVGVYLVIPVVIAVWLTIREQGKWKLLFAIASILGVIAILISTTLTALLMLVGAALSVVAILVGGSRMGWRSKAAAFVAVPVLAILLMLGVSPIRERVVAIGKYHRSAGLDRAVGGRLATWTAAMKMIAAHPVLGVGPGRFHVEFMTVASPMKIEHPDLFSRDVDESFDMVHNDYLEIAVETGLPGLLLTLYFVLEMIRRFADRLRLCPRDLYAGIGFTLIVTTLIGASVQFPFQIAAVYGSLAVIMGICVGKTEGAPEDG